MSQSPTASQASSASGAVQSPKQEALINYCRSSGMRAPNFQVVSDRRGGRTAWSCVAHVGGQYIQARYWYDGQYVNSAREDAAERALQTFGQMPTPPGPQPNHYQQQQQQQQQQPPPPSQQPQPQPPHQHQQQQQQQRSGYGPGAGSGSSIVRI